MKLRWVSGALALCLAVAACGDTDSDHFGDSEGGSGGRAGESNGGDGPGDAGDPGSSGNTSGGSSAGGDDAGGAGAGGDCSALTAETVPPTVLLLVDSSSSMFENQAAVWNLLFDALMAEDEGLVATYEERVRFGFTAFRGLAFAPLELGEDDPACALLTEVDFALDNYAAIRGPYAGIANEYTIASQWQTPSGHALRRAAASLAELEAPGKKVLLFVTDGNPDTCAMPNPQCGQDASIAAVQEAHAAGVDTVVVGIGEILGGSLNSGCSPGWPCDETHLQDLANAGLGLPVARPSDDYLFAPCFVTTGQASLAAEYAEAPVAENARYYLGETAAALREELSGTLDALVGCTFALSQAVAHPERGSVEVGGVNAPFDGPNGYALDASGTELTLRGSACERAGNGATLSLNFPCDAIEPF